MKELSNFDINSALLTLSRRSEANDREELVKTFVNQGFLVSLLSSRDHQIIYGRRGTGKTHALIYLSETMLNKGDLTTFIDLRTIGSSNGIYANSHIKLSERATRLLMDTLNAVHEELRQTVNMVINTRDEMEKFLPLLDEFAEAITDVSVEGDIEVETKQSHQDTTGTKNELGFGFKSIPTASLKNTAEQSVHKTKEITRRDSGSINHRVHFGRVSSTFSTLVKVLPFNRVWLLLDEWSSVPIELQPYLADLLRRAIFPVRDVVVKISAIEQRSQFSIAKQQGDYVGIELGSDATGDLNLDDFMVFDNDESKAESFFKELLFSHYKSAVGPEETFKTSSLFIQRTFTQGNSFIELVRAAEGVPRDAINIVILAVQRANDQPISMNHIRSAARDWYSRDKETAVSANPEAGRLLHWIIDDVIAHRKARAFLLKSTERDELINVLFDARVLHVLKRNISARDEPGIRYNVFKIDYGCYVDLINTSKNPLGLLPADGDGFYYDVPTDDYRAIRRAILKLSDFYLVS